MYFHDRAEAGRKLVPLLQPYASRDCVVYALPRGGVTVGVEIATGLKAPLDLIIARKIGHPFSPEYAIAAVTEHGDIAANEQEVELLDKHWFDLQVEQETTEAQRRRMKYMSGRRSYPSTGKTAILVDDGIATGLTMKAAIADLRRQKPAAIVVAIPVVPLQTAEELEKTVDDLVAVDKDPHYSGAVGAYYLEFPQLTDDEVVRLLDRVNPRAFALQFELQKQK